MRHRSHLVLPLLAAAALLLGACGDDDASDDTTTTEADSGSSDGAISLECVTLVEDGQLTVCSDMPYEPFEFQNEDGETEGFDYDVVSAMGDQLDVDVEFVTTPRHAAHYPVSDRLRQVQGAVGLAGTKVGLLAQVAWSQVRPTWLPVG